MMLVFVIVFGTLTWRQQSNFGTFGFDMGIYDQGIWLATHFHHPFMTVRGINFYGHHFDPIVFLFAPAYWLGAGPHFLYAFQTVALAVGAIPLWLLVRDKTSDPWIALVPAASYLLFPALEWIDWWHFHPDALIISPLMFAWLFYTRKKWKPFCVAVVLALMCKEDAAVAIFVMGIVMVVKGEKKWGVRTIVAGLFWFLMCTKLIIPLANGGKGPFYNDFFPGLGNSLPEILFNAVRHPSRIITPALMKDRKRYYWQLLAPVGGLPLLAPLILFICGPQAIINVVSDHPTHDIKFHYSAILVAAIFLATATVFARLVNRGQGWKVAVVALLVTTSVMANHEWSPSPLGRQYHSGIWAVAQPRHKAVNEALKLIKPGDKVAATYYIVPHLTHRDFIYEFPNPFHPANWGFDDADPPDPNSADTMVLDITLNGFAEPVYQALIRPGGPFRVVFSEDNIVVARRVHKESGPYPGTNG